PARLAVTAPSRAAASAPQRFSRAAGARSCRPCLAKHAARGPDRVERVALAGLPLPTQPANLEYPLLMTEEEASETGAERTCAFDREHTPARRVLIGKTKHARVTLTICHRCRFAHDTAPAPVAD